VPWFLVAIFDPNMKPTHFKQETIQKSNEKHTVPTQGQDLSKDTNYAKIDRWEPGVLGRQRVGDKVKNIHI
jgi:hypothetical protein